MPLEQLLLFALLIGIALVERLIRVMRARTSRSPVDGVPNSAPEPTVLHPGSAVSANHGGDRASEAVHRKHALAPVPPSATVPPAPRHAPPKRLRAPGRDGSRGPARLHGTTAATALRHSAGATRQGTARQRVFAHGGLRHGVVWMTILGHCRALEAHIDAPERARYHRNNSTTAPIAERTDS
jgi:hypothetical protein